MNVTNNKLYRLSIVIVLLAIIIGCTSPANNKKSSSEPDVASQAFVPFTLDNYGRQVEITQKPEKVLAFGPNATELLIALGLTDYIIGNTLSNHSRGALEEFAAESAKIPQLTFGPATREAVLTSGADFIYGIDWEFGEEGINLAELDDYNMKAYVNSASSLEEMYKEITDLGKIFNIEQRAQAFIEDQQNRIAAVQQAISGQEPVSVLIYDSGGNGVFTASGSNFETLLMQYAGGKNIFDDITDKQWTTVSYEEVLARNPDIILIHDYDVPPLEQKITEIKSDPVLSQLDAVKQERFVTISLESVLPGNRMAYTVEHLAKGFYPDLFK